MIITHKYPLYRAYIRISPESIGSRMLPTVGGLPITRETNRSPKGWWVDGGGPAYPVESLKTNSYKGLCLGSTTKKKLESVVGKTVVGG